MSLCRSDVIHGEVTFFDNRDGKKFGFIKSDSIDGRIFFHFSAGLNVVAGTNDWSSGTDAPYREPVPGDIVALHTWRNRKGLYAMYWCLDEEIQAIEAEIRNRPMFRLIQQTHSYWAPEVTTEIWRGKLHECWGLYHLMVSHGTRLHWFEVQVGDVWEKSDEPWEKLGVNPILHSSLKMNDKVAREALAPTTRHTVIRSARDRNLVWITDINEKIAAGYTSAGYTEITIQGRNGFPTTSFDGTTAYSLMSCGKAGTTINEMKHTGGKKVRVLG